MNRLNTKVVVVLISFIVVAVGAVGLFWGYRVMKDPARNVQQGRELEAAGDYSGAMRAYGRAVSKRRNSIEYIDLMRGALLKIVPTTAEEARQHYQMSLALLEQRAQITPSNPEPWERLLEALSERASFIQGPQAWQAVADTARQMLEGAEKGSDAERTAMRELGFANARREAQLTDAERTTTEEQLREVLAKNPKDARAWDALLLVLLSDANRLRLANQERRAQEREKAFGEAMAAAEAAIPGTSEVAIAKTRMIRSRIARGELTPADALVELDPELDVLERTASAPEATRELIAVTVDLLLATSRPRDAERAVAITEQWIARHPTDLMMRRLQAIALRDVDPDRSIAISRQIVDASPGTVGLQAAFRDELRLEAAERIFDVEFVLAQRATDDAVRKKHIAAAETARKLISELTGGRTDNPRLLKADAKTAFLAGDYVGASAKIDRLLTTGDVVDPEIFVLAADSAFRRNELGLALSYVNRGVERAGPSYGMLLARARIELGLRRGAEALRTTEGLLSARPGDPEVTALRDAAQQLVDAVSPTRPPDPLIRDLQDTERLMSERNIDGARAIIDRLLKSHPNDVRVLTQSGRVELTAGESARAVERLDAALAIAPNDPYIVQLRAIAETADPIERLNKLVELSIADEARRPAARYAALMAAIASLRKDVAGGGRAPDGRMRDLDDLQRTIARFEAELPAAREAAAASGTPSTALFTARFDDAVVVGDFKAAEQAGVDAEQSGDVALGAFLRARAMGLQGRGAEGIQLLERARQQGINSVEIARQLGELREAAGQVPEALAAYKEAFERRPNDSATLRAYSELLHRAGDSNRALQLYRDAAQSGLGERAVVNAWLRLEDRVGDRSQALCFRRRIYQEVPSDRDNALALAEMLVAGQADPRLIVGPDCRARFSDTEWNALTPARRQQEVMALLKANEAEGAEIFRRMLQQRPDDFAAAVVHARAMRRAGRTDDGEKLLRAVIAKADASQVGPMWFGLGQYLDEAGKSTEALAAFEESRKYQDPKRREADATISDYWFGRQQWQRSYDALKSIVDAQPQPDPRTLRRLAEIAYKLRRFDEAEQLVQRSLQETGGEAAKADAVVEMLLANISLGRGEDLWTKGDTTAAKAEFAKSEAALRRAAALEPGNALPWLSLASVQRDVATRTKDPTILVQAQANAERGVGMASGFWPGVRLLHEIQLDRGDLVGATQTVERYLPTSTENADARRALADVNLRAGNVQRAIGVLNDGSTINPNETGWPMAIGELQMRRGLHADAIRAFDRALTLSPSAAILARAIDARQRSSPPDFKGIVELAKQYPNEVRGSGAMRSALGAALYYTGERDNGLKTLRETGRFIRDEIAAQRMRTADLDAWYAAVRQVFPGSRMPELDAFVLETFNNDLKPDDLRWLAALWTESGPDGVKRADEYLTRALAVAPSQDALFRSRLYLAAGNLNYIKGDCPTAITDFEKVVAEDPSNAMALNNLGFLLVKCRDEVPRAVEYARRAVAAAPTQPEFLDTLGYVLVRSGAFEEGRTFLERAINLQPSAATYLHLAEALKGLGRTEDARTALDRAVELKPDPETSTSIETLRQSLK